eukprot:TRINITY_DN934_c0_g1_i1.p1 TRINITY_DN934_c0_g1~~TRINITY_DN934_c0_g1_i1.p1  ORF type:complete len:506 (+),score=105.51 TRINITY_DN934_c0_g1_i1:66-1583(+)
MSKETDKECLLRVFQQFDSDNSGTIDRSELSVAMKTMTVDFTDEQVDKLMIQVDTNGDGVLDYVEFVDWITDRSSAFSIANDGWLSNFDLAAEIKPMFDCFDKNGDGSISKEEFLECYSTVTNCLKMMGSSNGPFESPPLDALKTVDVDGDETVSFAEFLKWQKQLLQHSGIANAQIPILFAELSQALDMIFSIDRMHHQKIGHDGAEATDALRNEIRRVSTIYSRLYHSSEELADMRNPPLTNEKLWKSLRSRPSVESMKRLVRQCCKDHGILLPMMELESSSLRRSQTLPKSRVSNSLQRRRQTLKRKLTLAIGEVTLCIPELQQDRFAFELKQGQLCWLAEVMKSGEGGQQAFYYELEGDNWVPLKDCRRFDHTLQTLPQAFTLAALLNAYAYMTDTLSWSAVQQALTLAYRKNLISADVVHSFETQMRKQVQGDMLDLDLHHDALEAGRTLAEAVSEHLDSMTFSPAKCMEVLSGILADGPTRKSSVCSADDASTTATDEA